MNKFLKIILISFFAVFLLSGISMAAAIMTVNQANTETDAINALNAWVSSYGFSSYDILENFESYGDEVPGSTGGQTTYTSPGGPIGLGGAMFTAVSGPGQGGMSFNNSEPKIGVIDRGTPNSGRTLRWDTPSDFDDQYLDSGDVQEITLTGLNYDYLFFFMFDVADTGGEMTLTEGSGTFDTILSGQPNGQITFVGIYGNGDPIQEIAWSMTTAGDGFGLDNFGVPSSAPAIPEPATMLLLGSGLMGLGVIGRKKFFKKS
jgi:hypothetical protein